MIQVLVKSKVRVMALKLLQRLPKLLGQKGTYRYASFCPSPMLLYGHQSESLCAACTSTAHCIQKHGFPKLTLDMTKRGLTTTVRAPPVVDSSSFVGLSKDSFPRVCMTQTHQLTAADQEAFYVRLIECTSSQQVFTLLHSMEVITDFMAAASLHRVADFEQLVSGLEDPSVLEKDIIISLCQQLENDSSLLTDGGLTSALLACTRLYLDPWSSLVVRLVSECQERLDQSSLSVGQLCELAEAFLAMEGPGSIMLEHVMSHIQKQDMAQWTAAELRAVYKLLQRGEGFDMKYRSLLNAMNMYTARVTSQMNPATVSELLGVLMFLKQTNVWFLVSSLCKQAAVHLPYFTDEELILVLGALTHFTCSDMLFVDALEKYAPTMAFTSHPETVTKIIYYLGRRNILSPLVFDAVAESFVSRAHEYSVSQVCRQIMPFGKLHYLPPNAADLFKVVDTIIDTRFSEFRPRTLLNLLHSLILVEKFPVNFVSRIFSRSFLKQLQEEGTGPDDLNLYQLTQLYMTMQLECPSVQNVELLRQYRVTSFYAQTALKRSVETRVEMPFFERLQKALVDLLGGRSNFGFRVTTPHCYTLDVQIKLDEDGQVLHAWENENVCKRIALCIDGKRRFTSYKRQLIGKEVIKQRHLRILGYEVVQIPYYEIDKSASHDSIVKYLRQKIFHQT